MYENFYGFREKPFSLLPDAGFLYLSNKHRMALTLLEYGLMNQAGFTVISGDIGTGKTTLIRQLLNNIDPLITVGLISNTHRTFGDLMQWIALAFALPHQGKDKVQLYQDFMEFIIQEYAHGRRTVLIVDEAQNLPADTLEELRMLSNVNADKDQVLQIILVGQRELRDTLRRPDLVQFAQRIGVDYHLDPLSEEETSDYIQHRCKIAGGKAELFSAQARQAVFEYTGGVPRLVNLLCDTALVYGYAEQRERLDARLIHDVARDKQQGGLFPGHGTTAAHSSPSESAADASATRQAEPSADQASPVAHSHPVESGAGLSDTPRRGSPPDQEKPALHASSVSHSHPAESGPELGDSQRRGFLPDHEKPAVGGRPVEPETGAKPQQPPMVAPSVDAAASDEPPTATDQVAARRAAPAAIGRRETRASAPTGNLRVAIGAESELLRIYLSKLLSKFGIQVVAALPLDAANLGALNEKSVDVLLVELDDHLDHLDDAVYELLDSWEKPVLFNDSLATEASLSQPNRLEYGSKLSQKLYSLAPQAPQSVA
ncbi:MAG: AAA family ATPase [Thiogranum sp.]